MNKYIPLNKQSKRQQREYHRQRRGDWNGLSPVTRADANPKAYDRNKSKKDTRFIAGEGFGDGAGFL